ncbi:cidABC operon transcriptional activator CidR [Aneurinibacillus aneurinilyticus]|jgi:DNA-binding transcriptional LysR family regulator|uniref:LysR family transcriptional regulator n=2 Tax=Aneurinibacillus aneurinilyticus TaxID=1391 RepID=A0A848CT12_ANEAE|nr:LysR family transcriptional regulator [Aneurinibacillus aneurinilyticus]ERI09044.1 LysR substrate binding domain protein [Aneurinibacillus aneurinilyticus ATCC 12856]MCI1693366.1 LysR family transcriptional regulator [Aneurinibacillus aneurinilyticus]MED0707546.1 LysR family transcriptional regulator [Aneurinibacillus aneurinilyticus]MED0723914.1 LysR family transcriptional regulator [Aneurinibacillus aneurinilyticus]MED0731752.1 LysR family transcriptional regulator [Aneurinibacillus aneur
MDVRHLQYFLKVAHYKNFTKAAQDLYITQPTISKMIKNIEEELGVVLFNRSGKQVELTDAGQAIFIQAQDIVNSFQNLSSELDDLRKLKKGFIRIGLPPMIGSSFFPKVIGKFHEQYPEIMLQLVEDGAKKVGTDVENGVLDIGVVLSPTNEEIFHSFSLVKEKLKLLVHPSHRLANREAVALTELAQEAFVFFREDFALHDRIIAECVQAGFQPHVIYESSQWDFISEMVAANLGVAFLPEPICRELDTERIRVLPLIDPVIPWHLVMIWRKDRYLSFAAREWIRFTQDLFLKKRLI